jgi:hypothetical protein
MEWLLNGGTFSVFLNLRGFRPRIPEEFWTTSDRRRIGTLVFAPVREPELAVAYVGGGRSGSDLRRTSDSSTEDVPRDALLPDDVSGGVSRTRLIEDIPMDVLRSPELEPDP